MIIKEPQYQQAIDYINELLDNNRVKMKSGLWYQLKRECAGIYAEKQMAYELKRYFQASEEIEVYNNLQFRFGEVTAQIDHLVYSRRAYYLVESKSISGVLAVNKYGEFSRDGKQIDSPVNQVRSQKKVFIDLINANLNKVLGKMLGLQKQIGSWNGHEFVAVSEKAKISGDGREELADVLVKYDNVSEMILQNHKATKPSIAKDFKFDKESLASFNIFSKKELPNVAVFLKSVDIAKEPIDKIKELIARPEFQGDIVAEITAETKTAEKPVVNTPVEIVGFKCGKCGSGNIQVAFGRSYYFKCSDCDGNTPIKLVCDKCGEPAKTRKQKNEFFKVCPSCNTEVLYFTNSK